MKKNQIRWLIAGMVGAALFACQPKNPQPPSKNVTPCMGKDCPAPPAAPYQDKAHCRENECDEQEAGEEATVHVIEITEPEEQANTMTTESSFNAEPTSENQASSSVEATSEISESIESNSSEPLFQEGSTTHIFDDLPTSPISENTVVLSLEE